jgi:uncharacterized membrane protein
MKALHIAQGAMIAALYVVLTYAASFLGLASGAVQVRFSEALTVLPFFTAAAIPGLAVGCLLANFLTGCLWPDIVFGSLATLIGALGTYAVGQKGLSKWLAPLPPIVANAVIVPFILYYAYGLRPLWFFFVTVTAGEVVSCGVLGMILLLALEKRNIFHKKRPL